MEMTASGAYMDPAQVAIKTDASQRAGFKHKGLRTSKLVCLSIKKVIVANKTRLYL